MRKSWPLMLCVLIIFVLGYVMIGVLTSKTPPPNINKKLQVVTSFYPMYYFSLRIGGDKADITNITPSGAEPHDYEPTARDIAKLEKSDLVVLNGVNLELWGEKIKENLKGKNVVIVTAGEKFANKQDPHVWLSPSLAKEEVKPILDGYLKVDPKNKDYYSSNTNKLLSQLDELDKEFRQGLMDCGQRDIITSHAAFGYLARAYGLNQVTITGISPDEEPSQQQLIKVSKFAKEHNIKYIFFEKLVSPKLSETIAQEIGAKTLVLDPIEGISENDMKKGKNYFTIMKDNLNNLRIALTCR